MNPLVRNSIFCIAVSLLYIAMVGAAESNEPITGTGEINIELNNGLLSVEAYNVQLYEVIREIGELADFKTILAEEFVEPQFVNISFKNIAVRVAVERLISDKNRIIFFAREDDKTGQRNISQVWLLGSSDEPNDYQLSDEEATESNLRNTISSGRENVVKGHKLIKLTKMLQEGQQVQVRTRAAIALGKLKNQGAIFALESALLDQNASVRSKAINALSQVGGDRATMILGNILINSGADISERVFAAQALWQLDSETATNYLRAGAYDTVEQVRLASSQQTSSKAGANTKQNSDIKTQ